MVQKVTIMVLKVDLQCQRCYEKVKKVLCKFPQIQDQVYDEKKNTVTIKVVCCSPEKIMQKIRCKGCDSIKSIEIKPPPPPPPPPSPPQRTPPPPEKNGKDPGQPSKPCPKEPIKVVLVKCCGSCSEGGCGGCRGKGPCFDCHGRPNEPPPIGACCSSCAEGRSGGPCFHGHGRPNEPLQIGECCSSCSEGRGGGPCFDGHGRPPPCYVGSGRPVYDSYGGGWYRGCYVRRSEYFCEEYPSDCTVM